MLRTNGRLKQWREEAGLTQIEFSRKIGVRANTVSRWERGESVPRRKLWKKFSRMTGITVGELIADSVGGHAA